MSDKLAVVLFNLGGPDRPEAVEPFLFNLFNDPAIIGLPAWLRRFVARRVARRRAPVASALYHQIGGASPLLALTREQGAALEKRLAAAGHRARAFVCMRYWHPMSDRVAAEVKAFAPKAVVLLPLYPQFSITTTASSLDDWRRAAQAAELSAPSRPICCYPREPGLIDAYAELTRRALEKAAAAGRPRVLFSAHGLPERIVARGDPYPWQVRQTVAAVLEALAVDDLDHVLCYQSRVGPLKWIGPSIGDELARAGRDRVPVVVVPISFVSEHSETLVELDIGYAELARGHGVPAYVRVPAVSCSPAFIAGLARLVEAALGGAGSPCPAEGARLCPASFAGCPCQP